MIHRSNHESADQYLSLSCLGLLENKPQIMAPRVTPLEGVSTSTVAPVDVAHTHGCSHTWIWQNAPQGIRVRGVENPQGFGIDERRFANLNIQRSSEVYLEQSSAIPVTMYEKAAASRFRTRMTRIARIFADTCSSASFLRSILYRICSLIDEDINPQISQIRADLSNGDQTSVDDFSQNNRCANLFYYTDNKPQRSQRTQSRIAHPCALNVIYGRFTLFTAWLTRIYPYPFASASSAQSAFYFIPSSFCVHPRQILSMKEKAASFYNTLINKAKTISYQKSDLNDRHLLFQRT